MSRIIRIPLDHISPSPHPPRSAAADEGIAALAESISHFGLLAPLLVRRLSINGYELIAGARRLQALKLLGRTDAEAIILRAYDRDCALISLIENLEREELHFLDEAAACRRILHEHGLTQEELAANLNRSPSALANRLRLLRLDDRVLQCVREKGLSERHARALLRLKDGDQQLALASQAAARQWSVRRLEEKVEAALHPSPIPPEAPRFKDQRLIINAFKNTLRQLSRIGVQASSRVEEREESYDIIVTVQKHI